jgi:hypothetical protein
VRGRRALAQNSVGPFRDILDLHTGHGAIVALEAPVRNHTHIGMSGRLCQGSELSCHKISSAVLVTMIVGQLLRSAVNDVVAGAASAGAAGASAV